jgi:alkylation response protein AidB-like acyl-CoA dehydrogenase
VIEMHFDLTEEQQQIQRTAAEFLAARYPSDEVRRLAEDERGFTDEQWRAIVELGWPGIFVPEDDHGAGLGFIELAVLCEQLGYAAAPTPFIGHAAATLLLQAAGEHDLVRALVTGKKLGTVAWDGPEVVPYAGSADLVVAVAHDSGLSLLEDVEAHVVPALDLTRKLFAIDDLGERGGRPLAVRAGDLARARDVTALMYAADSVGAAQRSMEMAVSYARDREQFGRPIGSYQGVSHRCAQMLLEVEGARSVTYYAAWALDREPESAPLAVAMAKVYASDAGYRVPASALQVHGGIGFTWEHDVHLLLRRGKANAHALGDARAHRERVAQMLLDAQ